MSCWPSRAVLEKHDCLIFADDIYEKIVYDGFEVHNIVTLCPGAARARGHHQRRVEDLRHDRLAHRLRARPERDHRRREQIQSQSTSNPTSIAQALRWKRYAVRKMRSAIMVRGIS